MNPLTKEMINIWGLKIKIDPTTESGYRVFHLGEVPGKRDHQLTWKEIKVSYNRRYHPKSGKTKEYYNVIFSDYRNTKRQIVLPLHRLLYAYFIADVPANLDVAHIDDNGLNNNLGNLILETRSQNLSHRKGWVNQYGPKKVNREK